MSMMETLLMGLVAGARSITPLATVAWMARAGTLPNDGPLGRVLASPWVVAGTSLLAAGEILGDKMHTAPDRIVAPGLAARLAAGVIAGAALARHRDQGPAAVLCAGVAVGSSALSFALRRRAMVRFGQRATGAVEDGLVLLGVLGIASQLRAARTGP